MGLIRRHSAFKRAGGYSAEAQAVIDRMSGLTVGEMNAINAYVNAEIAAGNWDLYDEFYCFKLITEANALKGWKLNTATKSGAIKTLEGYNCGIGKTVRCYFTQNKYTLSNALASVFLKTVTPPVAAPVYIFFCPENARLTLWNNALPLTNILCRVNDVNNSMAISEDIYVNDVNLTACRVAAIDVRLYKNGTSIGLLTNQGSAGLASGSVIITHSTQGLECVCSSICIGAGIGFNHSGHYTNLTTLLNSL
jgi:hypothetical protein